MDAVLKRSWEEPDGPNILYNTFNTYKRNESNSTYFYNNFSSNENPSDSFDYLYITICYFIALNLLFTITTSTKPDNIKLKTKAEASMKRKLITNKLIYFLISLILFPILFTTFIILFLYRLTVYLILKLKFGNKFKGLLSGEDAVWSIEDTSKSIVTILVTIETKNTENIYEKIKYLFATICLKYEKLTYERHKQYGYYFWMKNNFDLKNHIKSLDINEKNIKDILGKFCNSDFPENNLTTWEIFVAKNNFYSNEKMLTHVIVKVHHSVGDGISLVSMFMENISDEKIYFQPKPGGLSLYNYYLRNFYYTFYFWCFGVGFACHQFLARKKDKNILHGNKLRGEKIAECILEEDFEIFEAIRRSKKKLNATFSEIFLTAVSSAFYQYIKEKSSDIPENITIVIPVYMGTEDDKRSDLENNFSMTMVELPINIEGNDLTRLRKIKQQTEYLKQSPDILVNYMFCKFASKYLPEPIIRSAMDQQHTTACFSNVPGPDKEIKVLNGCIVKDMFFLLPNKGYTGLGISILGYNGKIQMGLMADKVLIKSNEDSNKILKLIIKAVEEIDKLIKVTTQ